MKLNKASVSSMLLCLCASFILLSGCGGGGGSDSDVTTSTPSGSVPTTQPAVAAVIQGSVSFPTRLTNSSLMKSESGTVHYAIQSVDFSDTTYPSALPNTTVEFWAVETDSANFQQYLMKLGEGVTDSSGSYRINLMKSNFQQVKTLVYQKLRGQLDNLKTRIGVLESTTTGTPNYTYNQNSMTAARTDAVNYLNTIGLQSEATQLSSVNSTLQYNTVESSIFAGFDSLNLDTAKGFYRSHLQLATKILRSAAGSVSSISKAVVFRPTYNGQTLGSSDSRGDLALNFSIDFNKEQNLKVTLQDLEQKNTDDRLASGSQSQTYVRTAPKIIIQENVDLNANKLPDDTNPLVVYESAHTLSSGTIIRKYEFDKNGDGSFATGDDMLPAALFNEDATPTDTLASFVDINNTGKPSSQAEINALDQSAPTIEFTQPLESVITGEAMSFSLKMKDNVGIDLSTLRVRANKPILFLSPTRFTLAAGSDFAQRYFKKHASYSEGSSTAQTASFYLESPLRSFGIGNIVLTATVQDYAGNPSQVTKSFIINGEPNFANIMTAWPVRESNITTYIDITVEDVPPLSFGITLASNLISDISTQHGFYTLSNNQQSQTSNPALNWLSITFDETLYNFTEKKHSGDPEKITYWGNVTPKNGGNVFTFRLQGTPGNNLSLISSQLEPVQLVVLDNDGTLGNQVSQYITILPQGYSEPPQFIKICDATTSRFENPISRADVCTQPNLLCATPDISPVLEIAEKKVSEFIICGTDVDENDRVRYQITGHTLNGATASRIYPLNKDGSISTIEQLPVRITKSTAANGSTTYSAHTTSFEFLSTTGLFRWTPSSDDGGNHSFVVQATDETSLSNLESVTMSFQVSVSTIQDPPDLASVAGLGTRTNYPAWPNTGFLIYAQSPSPDFLADMSDEEKVNFFEKYRRATDRPIPQNPPLFWIQQGQNAELFFTITDDELPEVSNYETYVGNTSEISNPKSLVSLLNPGFWMARANEGTTWYDLKLTGAPNNLYSLSTVDIRIQALDPSEKTEPSTWYIPVEILDQNDSPYFYDSTTTEPNYQSSIYSYLTTEGDWIRFPSERSQTTVAGIKVNLSVKEDVPTTFAIHAYDIDPCLDLAEQTETILHSEKCPYFNPDLYTFELVIPANFAGEPSDYPTRNTLAYQAGKRHRSTVISWTPNTSHTWEQTEGQTASTRPNQFYVKATSPCPNALTVDTQSRDFRSNCVTKESLLEVTLNVVAEDEPPHFQHLTLDYQNDDYEDPAPFQETQPILDLYQGVYADLSQYVMEEEGQTIEQITVKSADNTDYLAFLINGSQVFTNNGSNASKYIKMGGIPTSNSVTYVSVFRNGITTYEPDTLKLLLTASSKKSSGTLTSSTKIVNVRIWDTPDEPYFVRDGDKFTPADAIVREPLVANINENESWSFTLKATNTVDFDHSFTQGFYFRIVEAPDGVTITYPHMPDVAPVYETDPASWSSDAAKANTTALFSWTPRQKDVDGVNNKPHDLVLESCLVATLNDGDPVCHTLNLSLTVIATNNPPYISFDSDYLTENNQDVPVTVYDRNNPFPVYEDVALDKLITVVDPEEKNMTFSLSLALESPAQVGRLTNCGSTPSAPCTTRSSGTNIFLDAFETLIPDTTSFSSALNQSTIPVQLTWSSIDWDDISTHSNTTTPALYILTLNASDDAHNITTTVWLEIQPVNDTPYFTSNSLGVIDQSTSPSEWSFNLSSIVVDEENDALQYSITSRNTASDFLQSTLENGTTIKLLSAPGESKVGTHVVDVKVQESNTSDNFTIFESLTLGVEDVNDAPQWFNTRVFEDQLFLFEGDTTEAKLLQIYDKDLRTSASLESIQYHLRFRIEDGGTHQTALLTMPAAYDTEWTTASLHFTDTTSLACELTAWHTESPVDDRIDNFQFIINPQKVYGNDPFKITTLYMEISAMDSYKSLHATTSGTVVIKITPLDDIPEFSRINNQNIIDRGTASLICGTGTCEELTENTIMDQEEMEKYLFKEDTNLSLSPNIHVTAIDQENENLDFFFTQNWGSSVTTAPPAMSWNPLSSGQSISMTYSPTNSNAGINFFTMKVQDQNGASSADLLKSTTKSFMMLVENTPDYPTLFAIQTSQNTTITATSPSSAGMVLATSVMLDDYTIFSKTGVDTLTVSVKEDQVSTVWLQFDDPDMYIHDNDPLKNNVFTDLQMQVLIDNEFSEEQIGQMHEVLIPQEYFSFESTNINTFDNFAISDPSGLTDPEVVLWPTTDGAPIRTVSPAIQITWYPQDKHTTPMIGQTDGFPVPTNLTLLVKSYASVTRNPSFEASKIVTINYIVEPVNDAPTITNIVSEEELAEVEFSPQSFTEALATQGEEFTFTIEGDDEEEPDGLSFHFIDSVAQSMIPTVIDIPAGMTINGNQIKWQPTNDDTVKSAYIIALYAKDTGRKSSIEGIPLTTPATSQLYYLKVNLNDTDDPAIFNASESSTPTTAIEDSIYKAKLVYQDLDFNDTMVYSAVNAPTGLSVQTLYDDVKQYYWADITWDSPQTSGIFTLTINAQSRRGTLIRSTVAHSFTVNVQEVNDPPRFVSSPIKNLVENEPYIYDIDVQDEDDTFVYLEKITTGSYSNVTCTTWPSYLVLYKSETQIQGTTDLHGMESMESTLATNPTSYGICLQATDGIKYTTQAFWLTIVPSNNPPTVTSMKVTTTTPYDTRYNSWDKLLITSEPLSYIPPALRKLRLLENVQNTIELTFYDEEGDLKDGFNFLMKSGPIGVISTYTADAGSGYTSSTLRLTWTPQDDSIATPPVFNIQARDNRNRETVFDIQTSVINTSEPPQIQFDRSVVYVNEDQTHELTIGATDYDPGSVLSYSIVTDPGNNPHPAGDPVFSYNYGKSELELKLDTNGIVRFTSKIPEPNLPGSAANQVPVTISICGTHRTIPGFASDCVSLQYSYLIQDRNDPPDFIPEIPPSDSLSMVESDNTTYFGSFFRWITFAEVNSCNSDTNPHIICVFDEETTLASEFPGNPAAKLQPLGISLPEVIPDGMRLTPRTAMCVPDFNTYQSLSDIQKTTVPTACVSGGECSGTSDCAGTTYYQAIQQFQWEYPGFDLPRILNVAVIAQEKIATDKVDTFNFSLDISNKNRAPETSPLVPYPIVESEVMQYDLASKVVEPDEESMLFAIEKGISGMTINSNTGIVSWTPNVSHIGYHLVRFRISDVPEDPSDTLTSTVELRIHVIKKNSPPTISATLRNYNNITEPIDHIAKQDQQFQAKVFAWDEEGDSFTFYASKSTLNDEPLPTGFNLTSFGEISWKPGNANVGANSLRVAVQDSASGETSYQTFNITVNNTNDAPVILNPISSARSVSEGNRFEYAFTVIDIDPADELFWSCSATTGTSCVMVGSNFVFDARGGDAGTYSFTVTVSDGEASDTNDFVVQVLETNNPPELEPVPVLYVNRQEAYNYQLYAMDPEGDNITYTILQKPASWTFNPSTGSIRIMAPTSAEVLLPEEYYAQTCQVYASDSGGRRSATVDITVNYTDTQLLKIESSPVTIAKILTQYRYKTVVSPASENGHQITFINKDDPESSTSNGIPIAMQGEGTDTLLWTPTAAEAGNIRRFIIRAQTTVDGTEVFSAPQRFFVTVSDENTAPELEYTETLENNLPVTTYDATEDTAFAATIATLIETDEEDLARLSDWKVFFVESKEASFTLTHSGAAATLEMGEPQRNSSGDYIRPYRVPILFKWTPDNGAAFAESNGDANVFHIQASDGIDTSNVIELTINVTNANDLPVFHLDENQSSSEISYAGSTYERWLFARDEDNQVAYFCLEISSNPDDIPYPGYTDTPPRFTLVGATGTYYSGQVPPNRICVKGIEVPLTDDNNSLRGKLSKAKIVYSSIDRDINQDTYAGLPMRAWDNVALDAESEQFPFTIKLAPTIDNLIPDAQFRGREVVLSGSGIVDNENQLSIKFIRSDGTIAATTTVYNISNGHGTFTVPDKAVTGTLSVGFSSFSSPVPFTVLNGETTVLSGRTETDLFSAPSGLLVTYIQQPGNPGLYDKYIFVSDKAKHTVSAYKSERGSSAAPVLVKQWGKLSSPGDAVDSANDTSARFNFPTGLSFAQYQNRQYVLVADTDNNKIKAIEITNFYTPVTFGSNLYKVFLLASSSQLNRPYKAVQHPGGEANCDGLAGTQKCENYFYIANTFGNTIEVLNTANESIELLDEPYNLRTGRFDRTTNTKTAAGTGTAKTDANGNLFHPVDIVPYFKDGTFHFFVSNYSNMPYSYNNSFKFYEASSPNRNLAHPVSGITYQSDSFFNSALALGRFAPTSKYDADILFTAKSTAKVWDNSSGFFHLADSILGASGANTSLGYFRITNEDSVLLTPKQANTLEQQRIYDTYSSATASPADTASLEGMLYQTRELQLTQTVSDAAFLQTTDTKAVVYTSFDGSQVSITPIKDGNETFNISGMLRYNLPVHDGTDLSKLEIGTPFFYDTTQDNVDDLWLPFPTLGRVYIFPGQSNLNDPAILPLTFDTTNYYYFDSSAISTDCANAQCLKGITSINAGRVLGYKGYVEITNQSTPKTNKSILNGDDLILFNGISNQLIVLDSYAWSVDEVSLTTIKDNTNLFLAENETIAFLNTQKAGTAATLEDKKAQLSEQYTNNATGVDYEIYELPGDYCGYPTAPDNAIVSTAVETGVCNAYREDHKYALQIEASRQNSETYADNVNNTVTANNSTLVNGFSVAGINDARFHALHAPLTVTSDATAPVKANRAHWIAASGPTALDFKTSMYNLYTMNLSYTPAESCIGHFSDLYIKQICGTADAQSTSNYVCSGTKASAAIDLWWLSTDDHYQDTREVPLEIPETVPAWSDIKAQVLELEQIAIRTKPNDSGYSNVKLLTLKPSSKVDSSTYIDDTNHYTSITDEITSHLYCGMPYTRQPRSKNHMKIEDPITGTPGYRQYYNEDYTKADSIIYVTRNNEFVMRDFKEDTTSKGEYKEILSTFTSGETNKSSSIFSPSGITSPVKDFILEDINNDSILDIIALRSDMLTIALGTGNTQDRFFMTDISGVQELSTVPGPDTLQLLRNNTSKELTHIIVGNTEADMVSYYEHNIENPDAEYPFYKAGIHFKSGANGNSPIKAIYATDHYQTGNLPGSGLTMETPGVAIMDNYYHGTEVGGNGVTRPFSGLKHQILVNSELKSHIATSGLLVIQTDTNTAKTIIGGFITNPDTMFTSTLTYDVTTTPERLLLDDLNNDGIKDIVTVDARNGAFSVTLSQGNDIVMVGKSTIYHTVGRVGGVASADFDMEYDDNNQRNNDIVVTNTDWDSVTIYFNGGKASTTANRDYAFNHVGHPYKTFRVGNGPAGVTVADFNKDGLQDIAVANKIGNNICILYNAWNDSSSASNFSTPVFYTTGQSPSRILAEDIHTTTDSADGLVDLIVLNETGESVSVLINNGSGFNQPIDYPIAEYFPSEVAMIDSVTEETVNPFSSSPINMISGDFANMTTTPSSIMNVQEPRYQNLVVGYEKLTYTMKNIGDKTVPSYWPALVNFDLANSDPETLTYDSSMDNAENNVFQQGVFKSILAPPDDSTIFVNHTSLSPNLYLSTPTTSIELSYYTTSALYQVTNLAAGTYSTLGAVPATSAFNLKKQQLGSGIDAMSMAYNYESTQWEYYGAHSGTSKGVFQFTTGSFNTSNYVLGNLKSTPLASNFDTLFGDEISFNTPLGITLDPSGNTILVADSQNGYIRIVDLKDNVTRTMRIGNDENPISIPGITDIANVTNTYNYFALMNQAGNPHLLLINPSNEPISITTKNPPLPAGVRGFQMVPFREYLYMGFHNEYEPDFPTGGSIYRVNTSQTPYSSVKLKSLEDREFTPNGLSGMTLNRAGTRLYYSSFGDKQIRWMDFASSTSTTVIATGVLTGVKGIRGHVDGPKGQALLNYPRGLALNQDETVLYFIDGSSLRYVNLNTADKKVSTIAGDPFDTGILNGTGKDVRFIRPTYIKYRYLNGQDVLYISDKLAHNIRKVRIDP